MLSKIINTVLAIGLMFCFSSCNNNVTHQNNTVTENIKIVSLNGTISEILCALELDSNIVGVDVTSSFPEHLKNLPQMGHSHTYNIESIIALTPDYVMTTQVRGLSPEQITQLQHAGINVWILEQEFSINGTKNLINTIADSFAKHDKAQTLIASIDKDLATVAFSEKKPKVLFVYARGAGALQVAGDKTPFSELIKLAGGIPATENKFENYKPLTAESVIAANPDYVLMFEDGLKSIGGIDAFVQVPGIALTNAGKNKNIIAMDGLQLSGFGPRIAQTVKELSEKLNN